MISITPNTISNTIMNTENQIEMLPKNGNIGAKKSADVALKVYSNSVKYCSILYAVPNGSMALTSPETINRIPVKFCKKVAS